MNKILIYIYIFSFTLIGVSAQEVNNAKLVKSSGNSTEELSLKVDSILAVKFKLLHEEIDVKRASLEKLNSNFLKYESSFWKDYTSWLIVVFGALLALLPIWITIQEYVRSRTKKQMKAMTLSLENAKKSITDFEHFQTYQELYFEDVLKPTINDITDVLLELAHEERIDINIIEEITHKYYDFERVVKLTHVNPDIKNAAVEYIKNRQSNYLKIKLQSLLADDKMPNGKHDLKLLIHSLLEKYNGNS